MFRLFAHGTQGDVPCANKRNIRNPAEPLPPAGITRMMVGGGRVAPA